MATKTRKQKPARKKKAAARKPKTLRAKPKARPKQHKARKAAKPKTFTSSVRFHGESTAYRRARDKLLESERELRRHTEAVAAERRKLPLGGELKEDYLFEESDKNGGAKSVRFSELFAPDKHTLVIYSFMYGPAMPRGCPSCSTMLDALEGNAKAISQRVNLAVVARSPLPRILSHARDRGWYALRFLSSAGNHYNRDYHGELPDGSQMPILNVFVKKGDTIHHSWASELLYTPSDKGQDSRHTDFLFPLWTTFDLTPQGRGKDWYPKLSYM